MVSYSNNLSTNEKKNYLRNKVLLSKKRYSSWGYGTHSGWVSAVPSFKNKILYAYVEKKREWYKFVFFFAAVFSLGGESRFTLLYCNLIFKYCVEWPCCANNKSFYGVSKIRGCHRINVLWPPSVSFLKVFPMAFQLITERWNQL